MKRCRQQQHTKTLTTNHQSNNNIMSCINIITIIIIIIIVTINCIIIITIVLVWEQHVTGCMQVRKKNRPNSKLYRIEFIQLNTHIDDVTASPTTTTYNISHSLTAFCYKKPNERKIWQTRRKKHCIVVKSLLYVVKVNFSPLIRFQP